jgi:GWxTD domain-containing protein
MRLRFGPAPALAAAGLAAVLVLTSCSGAARPALDPDSAEFYRNARLIMTGAEEDIFFHLPDAASRKDFISDFWARRNPDPTAEVNEFQQEFARRVEYADKHFNEGRKGIDTDRGRIYVYLGPPDRVENFPFNQAQSIQAGPDTIRGPILWWVYYRWELGIAFADFRNTGVFKMYEIEGNLLEAIDQAKLNPVSQRGGGRPVKFDLRYDRDRQQLVVSIQVKSLDFVEAGDRLTTRFGFDFSIYKKGLAKERMSAEKSFSATPEELESRPEIVFEFPCVLPPGKNYVDVILTRDGSVAKTRKIFALKS